MSEEELANLLHAAKLIRRRWHHLKLRKSFVASELVSYMVRDAQSRARFFPNDNVHAEANPEPASQWTGASAASHKQWRARAVQLARDMYRRGWIYCVDRRRGEFEVRPIQG